MKKIKVIIALLIILAMLLAFIPFKALAGGDGYTLTFTATGTHTISANRDPQDNTVRTGEIIIDGQYVMLTDGDNKPIGVVTELEAGKKVQIHVADGTKGQLAYNSGEKFTLYVNGSSHNMNEEYTADASFAIQDYAGTNTGTGGGTSANYIVDFGAASWTVNNMTITASIEGKTINNGAVSISNTEVIKLNGFDSSKMQVKVYGDSNNSEFNAKLNVNGNNETSLVNREEEGGYPNGTLTFKVEAKSNDPGPSSGGNTSANITVTAGTGTYETTEYNKEKGEEETVTKSYDAGDGDNSVNIRINHSDNWWHSDNPSTSISYDAEDTDTKVTFTFETLWIGKFYDNIVINGKSYIVSEYFNIDDRDTWLKANMGSQSLSFDIPNVAKADSYNVVVKHGESNSKSHFANFLWTADPKQADTDHYIGNSRIEFVKAVYEVADVTYTVTKDDLILKNKEKGVYSSPDGYLSYASNPKLSYDDGALTLPDGCYITMRCVPDYGYQVTEVNGGKDFTTTDSGVSEFTMYLPECTNGYFTAVVEEVDNAVTATSDKVKSGEIELGTNAATDIKNGTVRLSVDDIELSSDKINDFQNKASEAGDYTISNYLDINLDKVLYRGTADNVWSEQIHHLTDKALITLQLEEGVDVNNIVIVHNIDNGDEFEIIQIESYDAETNTITFYTDSFSNYAIATKTSTTSTTNDTDATNTTTDSSDTSKDSGIIKTGDKIMLFVAIFGVASIALITTKKSKKGRRVRKH